MVKCPCCKVEGIRFEPDDEKGNNVFHCTNPECRIITFNGKVV